MNQQSKDYTPREKVGILRRHLPAKEPLRRFLIFLMLTLAVAECRQKRPKLVEAEDRWARVAIAAVDTFHNEIKEERYSEVCARAEITAFKGVSELPCVPFLRFVHEHLGRPRDARRLQLPAREDVASSEAARVALDYSAEYEHGSAREHFEFRVAGEKATLTSYRVDSAAFGNQDLGH